ncbi:MAG: peptidylprolyl isomerase, partial [Lentisphaeria bacterium]
GELLAELEESLAKLQIGEISKPIATALGYHIIVKKAEIPANIISFNDAKNTIIARGKSEKIDFAFKDILTKLHKEAKIQIKATFAND